MNTTAVEEVTEVINARLTALQKATPNKEFGLAMSIDRVLSALGVLADDAEGSEGKTVVVEAAIAMAYITSNLDANQAVIKDTIRKLSTIRTEAQDALNDPPDVLELLKKVQS